MVPGVLEPPPSRLLLTLAGGLTQVLGLAYLVLGLAALPIAHELHGGTRSVIVSIVAALTAVVCGNLVYRGRMIPIALAVGLDVGFGIALARGSTAIGALLHILPNRSDPAAQTVATVGAFAMFTAAALCILAIPVALRLRAWARQGLDPLLHSRIGSAAHPGDPWKSPKGGEAGVIDSGPNLQGNVLQFDAGGVAAGGGGEDEPQTTGASGAPVQTLRGVGRSRIPATQVLYRRKSSKTAIIIVVSATLIAVGLVIATIGSESSNGDVISMASSDAAMATRGSAAASAQVADAAAAAQVSPDAAGSSAPSAPSVPRIPDLISQFHAAVGDAASNDLTRLFDPNVFAFGVGPQDVAQGRAAVVAMLRKNIGSGATGRTAVAGYFSRIGVDGDVGWFGEEMRVGKTTYVVSAALGLRHGAWSIFALHWALALPNAVAHQLAYRGELEIPDSIPNGRSDLPLAKAMLAAFSSRTAFADARSIRADALNFGSAPGERSAGESAKRMFSQLKAKIRLHDAVTVGSIGEHGGWGAANVDYIDADKAGREIRQTFRVLSVWLLEDDQWRIVQTQWSNGH